MLVRIGTIAVLIRILLPALSRSRAQAQVVKCPALMRQITAATIMYANDKKGAIPPLRGADGDSVANPLSNAGYSQQND